MTKPPRTKNAAAAKLGAKGGKERAKRLTAAQLSTIGRKGAKARWGTKRRGR